MRPRRPDQHYRLPERERTLTAAKAVCPSPRGRPHQVIRQRGDARNARRDDELQSIPSPGSNPRPGVSHNQVS